MFLLSEYTLMGCLHLYHILSSWLSPTSIGVILQTAKRCAALAFSQGIAKASISASVITLTTWPIVGVPQDDRYSGCKIGKVWDD